MHGTHSRAYSPAPIIDVDVAKTDTSFLTSKPSGTCPSNVPFSYSCNTWSDLRFFFLSMITDLRLVDSNGQGRILLVFSSVLPAFLLLFLSFLGALSVISVLSCHFLNGSRYLNLWVVPTMIFHCSLSLDFVCSSVRRSISMGNLLIGLSYTGN